MKNYHYVGKRIPRIDAVEKVTGKTKYATDHYFEGMLWAKVLRSRYAHAKIVKLDVERARKLPGVEAVLTHRDIPGHNGFGAINPNWPVLCEDRVRYRGDAVALVAARDEDTASEALALIDVEYEPLTVIDSPEKALKPDAVRVQEAGNILHSMEISKGEVARGFEEADVISEGVYSTQVVEHAYLETEGGVAVYDESEGTITVWCSNQYSFRDQIQIARSLNWDPAKIRVIGSPTGGAFGGKDEVTVQIHLALLAVCTKKPVYLQWTREESLVSGVKRHAMEVSLTIGAKKDGSLTAIDVGIVADAGPYDTLSSPVLSAALECSSGPYRYSNSNFTGVSVYTNNPVGGAFRGFGVPQVLFGLELEMNKLAEKLGFDLLDFRLRNAVEQGDISAIGHRLRASVGIRDTLKRAQQIELWAKRHEIKREYDRRSKFCKHGVGLASVWQAVGMGAGIADYGNITIEVGARGRITLRTGSIEYGQGNITAYAQMLAEAMECDIETIEVVHGDTFNTPDTGSVAASRSVMINGNAILDAVPKLKQALVQTASETLGTAASDLQYSEGRVVCRTDPSKGLTLAEIADLAIAQGAALRVAGYSEMMETAEKFGDGIPHNYYAFATQIALVGVDTDTGQVDLVKLVLVPEMGRAINITGVEGQSEGGGVMGQGFAMFEEVVVKESQVMNRDFSTYIIPTSMDVPETDTIIVEKPESTGPFGAKGVGEVVMDGVAPAVAAAIYDAVGIRLSTLPITPEKVIDALREKNGLS